jgi:hypothetical protein
MKFNTSVGFAHKKTINAGDHLLGEVTFHCERSGIGELCGVQFADQKAKE